MNVSDINILLSSFMLFHQVDNFDYIILQFWNESLIVNPIICQYNGNISVSLATNVFSKDNAGGCFSESGVCMKDQDVLLYGEGNTIGDKISKYGVPCSIPSEYVQFLLPLSGPISNLLPSYLRS